MPTTRAEYDCWLIGQSDSVLNVNWILQYNLDEEAKNSDLEVPLVFVGKPKHPTTEEVLRMMLFFQKSPKLKNCSYDNIADIVLEDTCKYWRMRNIPMISKWLVKKQILNLLKEYQNLAKNKNRQSDTEIKKRESYVKTLSGLFDIASPEVEEKMRKDRLLPEGVRCEDICFLQDQRGPRLGWMNGQDFQYSEAVQNKMDRDKKEEEQQHKETKRKESTSTTVTQEDSAEEDNHSDLDYTRSKKKRSDTVTLEVPKKIFTSSEVASMLYRTRCSSRVAVGVTASILKAAGANL